MSIGISLLYLALLNIAVSAEPAAESKALEKCQHSATEFQCVQYVKNYDGDTVTFNIPGIHQFFGRKISVRVSGVDTPEVRTRDLCEKEKARTARKLVSNILSRAKRIDLKNVERGKYFRVVADVVADGKSLKTLLLKNSLARHYDGGAKSKLPWCEATERATASE
ncbi:MAG: thermonuclease family protein [Bdellovibrionales bacterium]|nr:thermonuclease family protein [Bdellovibrionales bacterium]